MPTWRHVPALAALVVGLSVQASAQATIAGTVRHADRSAADRATVTVRWRVRPELPGLVGLSLGLGGAAEARTTTDAAGRWKLDLPVAGPFEVRARSADGAAVSVRTFPVMGGGYVEHVLEPTFVVAGVVRSTTGEPQAGLAVRFEPPPTTWTRLALYGLPALRGDATTGPEGGYSFDLGVDYLRNPFWEPFLSPTLADPARAFSGSDLLRPTAACRSLDLVVAAPQPVHGVVRDATGQPVAGALVSERAAPWRQVTTGSEGRFAFATRSPQGLMATRQGAAPAILDKAAPKAPDAQDIELVLRPGARVRARLRNADGTPLAACDVLWATLLGDEPPLEVAARTDAEGATTFVGSGLVAGFVRTNGLYQQFLRARVDGDLDRDVVVALRPVHGTVATAAGTPLAAARIVARAAAGLPPNSPECLWVTYTDHGGRFAFATLPAGELELFVDGGVHGLASGKLAADVHRHDVRMAGEGVVEVEVVGMDGKPVAAAWVTLVRTGGVRTGHAPAPGPTSTAVVGYSDAEGRVRFTGLPEGGWTVIANRLRGDLLSGGSADTATGGTAVVQLRTQRG